MAAKKGSGSSGKVSRSAVSGKFVKESYAKTHKNTTVTETVKRPGRAPPTTKKKQ